VTTPPSVATRVVLWDAALAAVRRYFRDEGLREVMTPPRVVAVAIEPWIDPVFAPPGCLHTSPELAMKSLLAHGGGPMFQVTFVARAAEHGAWHREQFVLLEWYRTHGEPADDVERLIEHVVDAVAQWRVSSVTPPRRWTRVAFLDAVSRTTGGLALRGDEDAETLANRLAGQGWSLPPLRAAEPAARRLEAWTAWFTQWSDGALDPWLAERAAAGEGIHLIEFPEPLAALAERSIDGAGRAVSGRFESHAFGRELANGYRELRDAAEQRARFDAVAALRLAYGQPALPSPEAFLADLADPGLPPCSGAALGLDRLLALAIGADGLDAVALVP
jgi:elongation factor P--(R)-beta-lysine ligase